MYITLETDYAIRIMICLIEQQGRIDAKNIAEKTDVTLRFALKILRKLVAAGFVRSYKGIKGGYEFAGESALALSLYDVVLAIEGEPSVSRCVGEDERCIHGRSAQCKVHTAFIGIHKSLKKELQAVTFDQLV